MRAREYHSPEALKLMFMRRRYLSELQLRATSPLPEPSVFISFASASGLQHKERAVKAFQDQGFLVRTGWDPEVQEQDDKLKAIKAHIRKSAVFLGILTKEYVLGGKQDGRGVPGVWVLEETGIAGAYEMPMRLLIDQDIHEDFFVKVRGDKLQNVFSSANYETELKKAVDALVRRYNERMVQEFST